MRGVCLDALPSLVGMAIASHPGVGTASGMNTPVQINAYSLKCGNCDQPQKYVASGGERRLNAWSWKLVYGIFFQVSDVSNCWQRT